MPQIGPLELIVVLVIALIVLGPGRLPEVGSSLGRSIREFRKAASDVQESTKIETTTASAPQPPAAPSQPAAPQPQAAPTDAPAPNTLSQQSAPNELSGEPKA